MTVLLAVPVLNELVQAGDGLDATVRSAPMGSWIRHGPSEAPGARDIGLILQDCAIMES